MPAFRSRAAERTGHGGGNALFGLRCPPRGRLQAAVQWWRAAAGEG